MEKILQLDTVQAYNDYFGIPTHHPLVNVVEGCKIDHPVPHARKRVGMYVIFLKELKCTDVLTYGRNAYDYQENTMVFIAPGQIFGHPADGTTYQGAGWCLMFHPDLLRATPLGRHIKDYTFFTYAAHEALHLSLQERETIIDCMKKIDAEINLGGDRHSNTIIASAIELLLNYCTRFYDRQFVTRKKANKDVLTHFETLLDGYFSTNNPQLLGKPTVAWCADQLHLSPNYFGDLIKKETGKSAQEYIQHKIIDTAKTLLVSSGKSISEIAYALGYQYPQYFSRAFKRSTGITPVEYRRIR